MHLVVYFMNVNHSVWCEKLIPFYYASGSNKQQSSTVVAPLVALTNISIYSFQSVSLVNSPQRT